MKNVFLITREEPRRYTGGNLSTFSAICSIMPTETVAYIYITNNDDVKAGNYYYNFRTNSVQKRSAGTNNESYKEEPKVILTNDPKLEKVQQLKDLEVEYLVDNPCEFVEYDAKYNRGNGKTYYSIIFSREKQKQQIIDIMKADEELGLYETEEKLYTKENMRKAFCAGFASNITSLINDAFEKWIKNYKQ